MYGYTDRDIIWQRYNPGDIKANPLVPILPWTLCKALQCLGAMLQSPRFSTGGGAFGPRRLPLSMLPFLGFFWVHLSRVT